MQIEPGQIAVLTGGGTGIGRALVRQLAAAGVHVAMCDLSEAHMAESRAEALAGAPAGTRITCHMADVGQEAQVLAFRDAVLAEHPGGHIHLLFNNAGTAGGGAPGGGCMPQAGTGSGWRATRRRIGRASPAGAWVVPNTVIGALWAQCGQVT